MSRFIYILLGLAVIGIIAGAVIIRRRINSERIKEKIQDLHPDAFKLYIKEIKRMNKVVKVGIFDKSDNHLDDEIIQSPKGVSWKIHKGQYIYI